MKIFCKDFRNQAMKIINHQKKEIIPLINEETESYEKQKDHCHYTGKFRAAAHNKCNLNYKIPKEIPIVFHNGSTCDYHFIIKQLAIKFKGKFDCLVENTKKYITFSAPINKKHDGCEIITYKVKFIDSFRLDPIVKSC